MTSAGCDGLAERLGWFPATIDFAQKLPYSGEFLLTAGITDTAHQASTPVKTQSAHSRPFHMRTRGFFVFVEGGSGTFDGRSIVPLPISYSVR